MLQSQVQINEDARPGRPKRWTNHLLLQRHPHQLTYFIPCYLRLKVKNMLSVDITKMQGQVGCDMIFSVFYGPLPRNFVDLLKSEIVLEFSRNNSIVLKQDGFITFSQNYEERTLNFTIRNTSTTTIEGDLHLSPFELLKMKLIVSVRSIVVEQQHSQDNIETMLRFNLMDQCNSALKLSFGQNRTFQSYCLAPSHTQVAYTNRLINQHQPVQQSFYPPDPSQNYIEHHLQQLHSKENPRGLCEHGRIKNFQYAHFYIGIYRYPMASLATVYVPIWSMAFYNLFVFFQYLNDLAMKINNGLVILLALLVYLPTIRSQIPDKPYLVVSQILLLVICLTFLLNLISGVYFQQQSHPADPSVPMQYQIDFWFYVAAGLVVATFVAVVVVSLVHKLCWEPSYLREGGTSNALEKFSHEKWGNRHADFYFQQFQCLSVIL